MNSLRDPHEILKEIYEILKEIYDILKEIGCLSFGKRFCLAKNFMEMKEHMDEIAGRYLEISNHVTN